MITAVRATTPTFPRRPAPEEVLPADAPLTSRAIVPVSPIPPPPALLRLSQRPSAPFLAQLIATDHMLPQTRSRNRAEPHDAIAVYADVARMLHRDGH